MNIPFPPHLQVPAAELGKGTPVSVRVCGDAASVARDFAAAVKREIVAARDQGRAATLIVPVGPVDPYPILARSINEDRMDCREVMFIGMDEYLDDDDRWIPASHPLSFRGHMDREFYRMLNPALAPLPRNRLFPDPGACGAVERVIASRGGVDACFGGVGINGHLAFNEPPEPGADASAERFAELPTRALSLARETRAINSVTVGGGLEVVPRRCVTIGMREILASRRLRIYCNRPWQSAVVRRALHGPITAACPASLLRLHPDAQLTVADFVAAPPDIRLR